MLLHIVFSSYSALQVYKFGENSQFCGFYLFHLLGSWRYTEHGQLLWSRGGCLSSLGGTKGNHLGLTPCNNSLEDQRSAEVVVVHNCNNTLEMTYTVALRNCYNTMEQGWALRYFPFGTLHSFPF